MGIRIGTGPMPRPQLCFGFSSHYKARRATIAYKERLV